MSINGKNIHKIPENGVFLDSNLNFTWDLANDIHICKKNMKNMHNIFYLI